MLVLHPSKASAILQWYNSLSAHGLQNVKELSDGKFLYDSVHSVFESVQEFARDDIFENLIVSNNDISEKSTESNADTCKKSVESSNDACEKYTGSSAQIKESGPVEQVEGDSNVEENAEVQEITQRFKFLQKFIDDAYHIESEQIINYAECMNSNELELAEVAIFILSAVVKHLLDTKNDKLNMLTLLDHKIQEDIQECLTLLLQNINKLTKKEVQRILSKQAKYKVTPRKNNSSAATPQRSCASKYRISSSPSTPFPDDVFTNSPLKSFLESPLFHHQAMISKDKELKRTRMTLHAEEIKCEDLQSQVIDLKKQLENKEKENKKLKSEIKKYYAQFQKECDNCEKLKEELNTFKNKLQASENKSNELEMQVQLVEKECAESTSRCTKAEGKYKAVCEELKKLEAHHRIVVKQRDEMLHMEKEKVRQLEADNQDLRKELAQCTGKLPLAKSPVKELESPVAGERLGSVIEVENKDLHRELHEAHLKISQLQKRLDGNSKVNESRQNLDSSGNSESDLSLPVLYDMSDMSNNNTGMRRSPRNPKRSSFLSPGDLNTSSSVNVTVQRVTTPQKTLPFAEKCTQTPRIKFGSLWCQCNDSNSQTENINNESLQSTSNSVNVNNTSQNSSNLHETRNPQTEVSCDNHNSLWIQFNDSGSDREDTDLAEGTDNGFSNTVDLYKKFEISKDELTAKMKSILITLLTEVLSVKGSNGFIGSPGDWEKKLKSDEDYILCLSCIKESLYKFQYLTDEALQDSADTDEEPKHLIENRDESVKVTCKCETLCCVQELVNLRKKNSELNTKISELLNSDNLGAKALKHLKQEIEELKIKAAEEEVYQLSKFEEKAAEYHKLTEDFSDLQHRYEELLISHQTLETQCNKMSRKCAEMEILRNQFSLKRVECSKLRKKCTDSLLEKEKLIKHYEKQLKVARERIIRHQIKLKKAEELNAKEREQHKSALVEIESIKSIKEKLDTEVKNLLLKNERLKLSLQRAQKRYEGCQKELQRITDEGNARLQNPELVVKKMKVELEVRTNQQNSLEAEHNIPNASQTNHLKEVTPLDTGNESSLSGALFNKSMNTGFLCNDDEEDFLNQSSLAEIKRDYEATENRSARLQELHRRNTMCLPHLQSSYPVELQTVTPRNDMNRPVAKTKRSKVPAKSINHTSEQHIAKKRKVTDNEYDPCEGSSKEKSITPVRKVPFKTPSSLQKLLKFRRNPTLHTLEKSGR